MGETTAKIGKGVRLQRETPPAVFTDLGELIEISGPDMTRAAIDASHSLSDGNYKEFIPGMKDAGEISETIALVPSAGATDPHALLVADFESETKQPYRLLFPDGATYWLFNGIVTGLGHAIPIEDRMTVAITIKVTGKPTLGSL
jgi:hypothetical protein